MDILTLGIIFGIAWALSTITFVVLYKKKPSGSTSDDKAIKQLIEHQKEQNLLLNSTLMQGLKNNELNTQNTINNLTMLQKQEFESISKRVDDLTTRNEQRIEKLTFDVNSSLNNMRRENEQALEKMREQLMKN